MKEGTIIMKCNCEHEFQDEVYGKGMRVHNVSPSGKAACTVCCPSLRSKQVTDLPANPTAGHGIITGRKNRNLKTV